MKSFANLCVGVVGTGLAMLTPERAAIFAGVSTGVWMLTQAFLAIRKEFFK